MSSGSGTGARESIPDVIGIERPGDEERTLGEHVRAAPVHVRGSPDLIDDLAELMTPWPEFMLHGNVVKELWRDLRAPFFDFQWVLHDEEADEVVGLGNSIPLFWDGEIEHLPDGFDAVLQTSARHLAEGVRPNTLSALQATVSVKRRGQGLSGLLIQAMRTVAGAHGFEHLIAPVRPTWKERYPLVPIERYMTWRRDDGLPFDPWLRLHEKLGGRMLAPCPRVDPHLRVGGRMGIVDRHGLPGKRRIRRAGSAGAGADRPRARRRRARRTERVGPSRPGCRPDVKDRRPRRSNSQASAAGGILGELDEGARDTRPLRRAGYSSSRGQDLNL